MKELDLIAQGVADHMKEIIEDSADLIFAADGAFSAVRYNAMQKTDRFNYIQFFIEDGYKELLLPPDKDGNYQIEKNALHNPVSLNCSPEKYKYVTILRNPIERTYSQYLHGIREGFENSSFFDAIHKEQQRKDKN